ncbi:Serine/threonine-protein kinase [Terramyces sp. JEL0728]|nr:Serine/threonine-protein kinase [Terramyces sp. JEL0728]
MEFCSLGDLSIFIRKRGAVPGMDQTIQLAGAWGGLDEFVARNLLGQLACAVEFLRYHKIIHRDLKPQNILLSVPLSSFKSQMSITEQRISKLPILKLGDFGFARSLGAQSLASTLCGSPLYMAPEILRGEKYDAKSDLWSMGAILYEILIGKTPFRAQNHIELLRKIEKGDGWIRFPDEAIDDHNAFQTREYHGGLQRPTLNQRKSLGVIQHAANNTPIYAASLGSSPRIANMHKQSTIPIPEDLKTLVRKLLKRNPVERMTFEEFFMYPSVVEGRELDTRNSVDFNQPLFKSVETAQESKVYPPTISKKLSVQSLPKNEIIQPPFPEYNTDPMWVEKVIDQPLEIENNIRVNPETQFNATTPILPPKDLNRPDSPSSFGSSIASIDFSSVEESSLPKDKAIAPQNPGLLLASDDFVLVEKGNVEVNWIKDENNSLYKNRAQSPMNSPPKAVNNELQLHDSRGSFPAPKGRLFGSLRNSALNANVNNEGMSISEISQQLPYTINIHTLELVDQDMIHKLNMAVLKSLSISRLSDQFIGEINVLSPSKQKLDPSNPMAEKFYTTVDEAVGLLVFSLGLFQYAMNLAKDMWSNGPANPSTGLFLSNIPNNNTRTNYLSCLTTIIQYIQTQFDTTLEKAETYKKLSHQSPSENTRGPERIIYETALSLSKHGAMCEIELKPAKNFYKSAIFLLQALIQPSWDSSTQLNKEDSKIIVNLLNQLVFRFQNSSSLL